MTYTTTTEVIRRTTLDEIIRLTDTVNASEIDDAVMARALAAGDAEIDSYLSRRYAVPLATVPDRVVDVATDLVHYKLFRYDVPESVKQRYDDAVEWLKGVALGKFDVPGLSDKTDSMFAAGLANTEPTLVFTESMRSQV